MKSWWRRVRPGLLSWPIYLLVRLIGATLKLKVEGFEDASSGPESRIYATWHGRTMLGTKLFRGRGVWTIISQSRDGELQNRIFTRFGFRTIRGSSGRGGIQALRESIRVLSEAKAEFAFTPDGPRGPSHVVQDGILLMAQKSGAVMVPVGVSARKRWLIRSWDRYMVPKPFSECLLVFGQPIRVAADATRAEMEAARTELQEQMNELERYAEEKMGHRHFQHAP